MSEAVQDAGEAVGRPVLLTAAREAAGLHIAALAASLKVPVRKLEALEAGRYGELPDLTFARALASSACRQLRIDPAPVLAQIPQGRTSKLGDSPRTINAPFKPASDPAPEGALSWLSRPAMLAAIVLLLGALVIIFLPYLEALGPLVGGSPARTPSSPFSTPAAGTVVTEVPLPVQEAPLPAGQADAAAADPAPPAAEPQAPVGDSPPAAQPGADGGAAAGASLLHLSATAESWVEVRNGAGRVVVQRVFKPGESAELSDAPPYTVVLGRAEAVQVSVRGEPFDVNAVTRNHVARFEVR